MNREQLLTLVEIKTDELFLAYQNANNIPCGDIYPTELLKLEDLQNQLTDLIVSVNEHNMPDTESTEVMTETEKLLAKISAHAQSVRDEEEQKKQAAEKLRLELLGNVSALEPRIKVLITLANKCIEEKVKFPTESEVVKYGYGDGTYRSYSFLADGINHHVGFMGRGHNSITHIGIYNGGACGSWDFYTNGTHTYNQYENNASRKENAHTNDMKRFLWEFDRFESAFLKWIDSL